MSCCHSTSPKAIGSDDWWFPLYNIIIANEWDVFSKRISNGLNYKRAGSGASHHTANSTKEIAEEERHEDACS